MIINFSVQNFGPIKDKQTLSFEATDSNDLEDYYIIEPIKGLRLLKLGLIYGPNASGKTTILKALDFLGRLMISPLDKKDEKLDYTPFLFDEFTPMQSSFISLEFVQSGIKYLYEVEFSNLAVLREELYSYNPKKSLVYERSTDIEKQLVSIKFGGKYALPKAGITALEANTIWNNTVLGAFLKTNIDSSVLKDVQSWFKEYLRPIITPRTSLLTYIFDKLEQKEIKQNNLINFLRKADLMVDDIVIKSENVTYDEVKADLGNDLPEAVIKALVEGKAKLEQSEIFLSHVIDNKQKYNLPLSQESDGTQRYYQFSGILDLLIRKSHIFLIDEIESSLHPDLFEHFLLTYLVNSKQSQLIATTHLREFLMRKDMFRNDAVWLTEKKEDGSTDLYSLADFDSSVIRNTSSIYNAYKIGKLGAVPNPGDYYIDLEDNGEDN